MLPEFRMEKYDYRQAKKDFEKSKSILNNLANTFKDSEIFEDAEEESIEFKEWFRENKEKYLLDKPVPKKIKYNHNKSAKDNGLQARNNALIDTVFGVLTSSETASQVLSSGNFNTLKKIDRIIKTIKYSDLKELKKLDAFKEAATINDVVRILEKLDVDKIDKLIGKIGKSINPLSPYTQVYFHHQNTNGGKLIGIYANNLVNHALCQLGNVSVNPEHFEFHLNETKGGRNLFNLSAISVDGHTISNTAVEFNAAAVDNVKDPVLAGLNQNTFTVNATNLLIRLGYTPLEVGLFMNQPAVLEVTNMYESGKTKGISLDTICEAVKFRYRNLAQGVNAGNNTESITTDTMISDIYENERLDDEHKPSSGFIERQIAVVDNLAVALSMGENLKTMISATKSDSQNAAAGPSIADVLSLESKIIKYTGMYAEGQGTEHSPFLGKCLLDETVLDALYTKSTNLTENDLREMLLNTDNPILNSFTALGIFGVNRLMGLYFPQFGTQFRSVYSKLEDLSKTGTLDKNTAQKMFNSLYAYILNDSAFFGQDNANHVGNYEKREVFINHFPAIFRSFVNSHPEVAALPFISKLQIVPANNSCPVDRIVFNNVGKLSSEVKDGYMKDWASLLDAKNADGTVNQELAQFALNLFRYSYYRNGFAFGPDSFIHLAPVEVRQAIPGYIEALRNIEKEGNTLSDEGINEFYDRFVYQFIRNNLSNRKFTPYIKGKTEVSFVNEDGSIKNEVTFPYSVYSSSNNEDARIVRDIIRTPMGTIYLFYRFIGKNINGKMVYWSKIKEDKSNGSVTYARTTPLGIENNFMEYVANTSEWNVNSAIHHKEETMTGAKINYIQPNGEVNSSPEDFLNPTHTTVLAELNKAARATAIKQGTAIKNEIEIDEDLDNVTYVPKEANKTATIKFNMSVAEQAKQSYKEKDENGKEVERCK